AKEPNDAGAGDAAPDAAPDAPAGDFCSTVQPTPQFCTGFDTQDPKAEFEVVDQALGTATRDPMIYSSPPNSLRVATLGSPDAGPVEQVGVHKYFHAFDNKPVYFDVSYSFRIDQAEQAKGMIFGGIMFWPGPGRGYFVQLAFEVNGTDITSN